MSKSPDEIDQTLAPAEDDSPPQDTEQQDFATRNVMMSNALPGGTSPVAGAVIGSGGDLAMDPETDEEEVAEATDDPRTDPRRE